MRTRLALILATALLAGCGSGGGSSSPTLATPAKAQTQSVTGSVIISIPLSDGQSSSVKVRYPQFVSPNASSVALSINGGADQLFNVASGSPLCTTTGTARNCTLTFGAPVGSDTFAFLIFAGAGGTGAQLASATTTQAISSGVAFNFTVAMNAAIGTVIANVPNNGGTQGNCPDAPSNFNGINEGCAGSSGTATFVVLDPSGATVTGTAPYATPIVITTNDPSVTAAPNQITAPGQTAIFTYNGSPLGATITNSLAVSLTVGTVVIPATVPVLRSYLYVANSNAPYGTMPPGNGNVTVYTFGASGATAPVRTLGGVTTGLTTPVKPLLDSSGNLYVLDNNIPAGIVFNPTIRVFAPGAGGNVAPIRQITNIGLVNGHNACSDMVFDPTGTYLFVSCGLDVWTFLASTNGAAVVAADYENDSQSMSNGIAFDPVGNFYVADSGDNAIFMIPGPVSPTAGGLYGGPSLSQPTGWPSTVYPFSIAVDKNGTLYAPVWYQSATAGGPDAQAELAIWKTSNLTSNSPPNAFLTNASFPTPHAQVGIVLDYAGNVYVDNPFTNAVTEFSAATIGAASLGTTAVPLRTLNNNSTGTTGSIGMAIGP